MLQICKEGGPPLPSLLKLDDAGASKNGNVSRCRGLYELQSRQVNGRPTWRHIMRHDTWLAYDSGKKNGKWCVNDERSSEKIVP